MAGLFSAAVSSVSLEAAASLRVTRGAASTPASGRGWMVVVGVDSIIGQVSSRTGRRSSGSGQPYGVRRDHPRRDAPIRQAVAMGYQLPNRLVNDHRKPST